MRLPAPGPEPVGGWPDVVAVVPARDEAAVLPESLPSLLAQDYPGRFEVVLVDDRSSDGTVRVAEQLAASARRPLRVVAAGDRPPGWAGKVWAMHCGLGALTADPALVWLTDADIVHGPDVLRRLVGVATGDDRDLVSVMAVLRSETGWERLVVPAFVYFFGQLYPFRLVARPRRRTAAAAGGCVLVSRAALRLATADLARMPGALIDDVTLARLVKRGTRGGRGRIWLGLSHDVVSARPYPRLADLWDMVARSAYTQLRHSPLLLAGTAAGLLLVYVVPPTATIAGAVGLCRCRGRRAAGLLGLGAWGWGAMTVTYLPMVRHYRLPARWAVTLPGAAVLYLAMTLDSAKRHRRGAGGAWKGRLPEPRVTEPVV